MNKVILMGRLTHDPEMRQTPNGVNLARFSIAINRRFQRDQTDFINCTAWRQTADFICRYFQKGSMIAVVGSIQTRSWDGQDGKKQYATEVVVDEAYFTGSRSETGAGYQNQGYQSQGYQNQSYPQGGGYSQSGGYQTSNFQPAPPQAPASAPGKSDNDDVFGFGDDFDSMGFSDMDDSEDDLPF